MIHPSPTKARALLKKSIPAVRGMHGPYKVTEVKSHAVVTDEDGMPNKLPIDSVTAVRNSLKPQNKLSIQTTDR